MKKLVSLTLALLLLCSLFALAACKKEEPAPDTELEINVWTLNGTTGFGMAQLMDARQNGSAALNYNFKVKTEATYIRDSIIAGKGEGDEPAPDIAAVPTNVAAALYNATKGGVKILALNTAGVLYVVTTNGDEPASLSDLAGKTLYCPAQNPAFIVKALLEKAELSESVTLNSTAYADPTDLRTAVVGGQVEYAVLPEPMVTIAGKANAQMKVAVDLTAEWDKYFTAGSLVQGCVIARTAFVENHPAEVKKFLEEYKASIEYVKANPAEASEMIASQGIFAQAPVAKLAIPKCNLIYADGAAMKTAMETFLAAMPLNAIGGKLPDGDFYYGA